MTFTLKELPYEKTALEPFISAKTLNFIMANIIKPM